MLEILFSKLNMSNKCVQTKVSKLLPPLFTQLNIFLNCIRIYNEFVVYIITGWKRRMFSILFREPEKTNLFL